MTSPSVILPPSDQPSSFGHRPSSGSLGADEFSAALQQAQQPTSAQVVTASTTTSSKSETTQVGAVTKSGHGGTAQYSSVNTYETVVSRDYTTEGGFDADNPWADGDLTVDGGGGSNQSGEHNNDHRQSDHDDDVEFHQSEPSGGETESDHNDQNSTTDWNNLWLDGDLTVDTTTTPSDGADDDDQNGTTGQAPPYTPGRDPQADLPPGDDANDGNDDDDSVGLPPPINPGGGPS